MISATDLRFVSHALNILIFKASSVQEVIEFWNTGYITLPLLQILVCGMSFHAESEWYFWYYKKIPGSWCIPKTQFKN